MTRLEDIIDVDVLADMVAQKYVRYQHHPTLELTILNYTAACQYDGAWNDTTRACRGLIYSSDTSEVVSRPWPKFHNYGEHELGTFDLEAPVLATDKLDGSLGILYPTPQGHAIATRGSFTSDQALHATALYKARYAGSWTPDDGLTYLFEIVYPGNRIVVDYDDLDDLVLLDVLETATGLVAAWPWLYWPGPKVESLGYPTLADALAAPPRSNREGLVVYFMRTGERLKIKQDDYVALHRILTGTNARNVWEVAAVQACGAYIEEPKHWGTYLGIDPARATEVLSLGDDWLDAVPDEFHAWVRATTDAATLQATESYIVACRLAVEIRCYDRRRAYEAASGSPYVKEVMRLATTKDMAAMTAAIGGLWLRAWREACPAPTAPFARSEDVA